ncbi:MAG TPA: hypothetical protein PLA50_05110 [Bacteroidia bacterium]|nr:hypothetical protein [Bacteroidia bacterium]
MTDQQISADVDRGLAIVAELDALKAELKSIETRLQQAALEGITAPLEDGEREGRQFLALGTVATLPVIIESDQVISSFPPCGEAHRELETLCGDRLPSLFREERRYVRIAKDGKGYRAALDEHFGPLLAPGILAASLQRDKHGVPRSRIVIPWDRAR